jgi:hypothetical protein
VLRLLVYEARLAILTRISFSVLGQTNHLKVVTHLCALLLASCRHVMYVVEFLKEIEVPG